MNFSVSSGKLCKTLLPGKLGGVWEEKEGGCCGVVI